MLELLLFIVVVGIVVWLVNTYTPIDQKFKTLVLWIGIVIVLIAVIQAFGLLHFIDRPVPQIR